MAKGEPFHWHYDQSMKLTKKEKHDEGRMLRNSLGCLA